MPIRIERFWRSTNDVEMWRAPRGSQVVDLGLHRGHPLQVDLRLADWSWARRFSQRWIDSYERVNSARDGRAQAGFRGDVC